MTETVTIPKAEYDRLVAAAEDAEDLRALDELAAAQDAGAAVLFPDEVVTRILDGEHPVRALREHRGLSQDRLAAAARVPRSYLSEIEGRKKRGSAEALAKLAAELGVNIEDLMNRE